MDIGRRAVLEHENPMITPHEAIADVAAVAAHYDDLDLFYRTIWGTHVHHGYWKTGKENRQEAVLNLTRLVAEQARSPSRRSSLRLWAAVTAQPRWFSPENTKQK